MALGSTSLLLPLSRCRGCWPACAWGPAWRQTSSCRCSSSGWGIWSTWGWTLQCQGQEEMSVMSVRCQRCQWDVSEVSVMSDIFQWCQWEVSGVSDVSDMSAVSVRCQWCQWDVSDVSELWQLPTSGRIWRAAEGPASACWQHCHRCGNLLPCKSSILLAKHKQTNTC